MQERQYAWIGARAWPQLGTYEMLAKKTRSEAAGPFIEIAEDDAVAFDIRVIHHV